VKLIAQYWPAKSDHVILPYWLAELGVPFLRLYALMRGTDPLYTHESLNIVRHSHHLISSDKAAKELGYQPRPIEMTVRDTIEWFKTNNYL
jgi:dihydroflavonol-4-reductase